MIVIWDAEDSKNTADVGLHTGPQGRTNDAKELIKSAFGKRKKLM